MNHQLQYTLYRPQSDSIQYEPMTNHRTFHGKQYTVAVTMGSAPATRSVARRLYLTAGTGRGLLVKRTRDDVQSWRFLHWTGESPHPPHVDMAFLIVNMRGLALNLETCPVLERDSVTLVGLGTARDRSGQLGTWWGLYGLYTERLPVAGTVTE